MILRIVSRNGLVNFTPPMYFDHQNRVTSSLRTDTFWNIWKFPIITSLVQLPFLWYQVVSLSITVTYHKPPLDSVISASFRGEYRACRSSIFWLSTCWPNRLAFYLLSDICNSASITYSMNDMVLLFFIGKIVERLLRHCAFNGLAIFCCFRFVSCQMRLFGEHTPELCLFALMNLLARYHLLHVVYAGADNPTIALVR